MFVRPHGKFTFSAAKLDDGTTIDSSLSGYNIYGVQADASLPNPADTPIGPQNLLTSTPYVADQESYEVQLGDIPGLQAANGQNYVFAVAAVEASTGNVAPFSNLLVVAVDETAPNAIADFAFSAD